MIINPEVTNKGVEVEVHSSLKQLIRQQGNRGWPHHLTMARLVARALRVGSSALMQTESSLHKYCLSYLTPTLIGNWAVIIVAPPNVLTRIHEQEIPWLQAWLGTTKSVRIGTQWHPEDCILLMTPQDWLRDRFSPKPLIPNQIPLIIDGADDLEDWVRDQLTITLTNSDWLQLLQHNPNQIEIIQNAKAQLTRAIFDHPPNRYECFLLENSEINLLIQLCDQLQDQGCLSPKFAQFWQLLVNLPHSSRTKSVARLLKGKLLWVTRDRNLGTFSISLAPGEIADILKQVWEKQTIVLIGSFLDREPKAPTYREKLGLPEILSVKFAPNQQQDFIRLFIPDRFPLANTPEYSLALSEKIHTLVGFSQNINKVVVVLVEDVPQRAQVASALAAKYGTRVKVDSTKLSQNGILVCGWQYWKEFQDDISTPQLLIMTTLPLPSLEHPLVASRVAHYKYQRQDWFRLYLLPTALKLIQQAIIPLRESQGVVALLDSRVNFRSYGKTILSVLEPCARINYIDPNWFID